ncbi:MAG: tRNA pseudouridine(55) synthase TruB [Lachnospiraceae bacterium]
MYHGIINVYKEKGFTSHDVVAKLRGILKQKKIGHTGTLDPDATGVLPVCLGCGTKLCDILTEKEKEYYVSFRLGIQTDTQDSTGKVLKTCEVNVTEEEVKEAIFFFQGTYDQIPPMYSALKVNGKKLYELAREGKEIERKARKVIIKELEILNISLPDIQMRVLCSKGTYIRSLCNDIGNRLGCYATMTELERTKSGEFRKESALTLSDIEELCRAQAIEEKIIAVDEVFQNLKEIIVKKTCTILIENGNALRLEHLCSEFEIEDGEQVRVYDEDTLFYGIYRFIKEEDRFVPVKMFLKEKNTCR